MTSDRYRTLEGEHEATLREKASRFIGIAFHAADEAALKMRLEQCAKDHHIARHYCHAIVLGDAGEEQRSNDAGEPSGTAGKPILRAIVAAGLTNTAVIVVRYFGGTLLGKGGLVKAYGDAARLALDGATIEERVLCDRFSVVADHAQFDLLKKDIAQCDGSIVQSDFEMDVRAEVDLPRSTMNDMVARWTAMGIQVRRSDHSK